MRTGYDLDVSLTNLKRIYRRLIMMGYTKEQAGNLIGKLIGLEANKRGWTTKEIADLLFLSTQKNK